MLIKQLTYIRALDSKIACKLFIDSKGNSSMKAPLGNFSFDASFILEREVPGLNAN
jgi:hypothetical protein